jgi:hypothetical protein
MRSGNHWVINLPLLLVVFFPKGLSAQTAVENEKNNIVYVGVENQINISAFEYPCQDVAMAADKGELKKTDECGHYIFTTNEDGIVTFSVNALKNGRSTYIDKHTFRMKYPPSPKATIFGAKDGIIGLDALNKAVGMACELRDFDYEIYYKIESFSYQVVSDGKTGTKIFNEGNKFNEAILKSFQQLKKGDTILFTEIKCKAPFKDNMPLYDYTLKVSGT